MRDLLRHPIAMLSSWRLLVLHIVLNALLLVSASFWLLIPEEHVWQLLFAALSALLILLVFLWLESGTLVYAADPARANFRAAFSLKANRLLWMLLGAFILFWCMRTVDGWTDSEWQTAGYLYSKAPSWLRPTAGDSGYVTALEYFVAIVFWYLLPCVFLPLIAARVTGGSVLRGFRTLGHWQYWVTMGVTALVGVWIPILILGWIPGTTLKEQTVGLVIRLTLAYLLAIAAWLTAAGIVGYYMRPGADDGSVAVGALWKRLFPAGGTAHSLAVHCLAVIRERKLAVAQIVVAIVIAIVTAVSPDKLTSNQVLSIVIAIAGGLALLVALLWLYSGTLAYAADPVPANLPGAFRFRIGRIGWLLLAAVAFGLLAFGAESVLWMLNRHDNYVWLISNAIGITSGYLLPCLLLPWTMAKVGTDRGFRAGASALRRWEYWLGMAVIVLLAQWISDEISNWHFGGEGMFVTTTRLALANLPLIIGWVAAAGLVGYFVGSRGGTASNILRQATS